MPGRCAGLLSGIRHRMSQGLIGNTTELQELGISAPGKGAGMAKRGNGWRVVQRAPSPASPASNAQQCEPPDRRWGVPRPAPGGFITSGHRGALRFCSSIGATEAASGRDTGVAGAGGGRKNGGHAGRSRESVFGADVPSRLLRKQKGQSPRARVPGCQIPPRRAQPPCAIIAQIRRQSAVGSRTASAQCCAPGRIPEQSSHVRP